MENNHENMISAFDDSEFANKIRVKKEAASDKLDLLVFHKKMVDFANNLKKNHPNFNDYLAYHLLIGSTPSKKLENIDFPGEDSVERFLDEIINS